MKIVTRVYPHNWSYQLNFVKGPFTDKRVRQAANYALNREDIKDLLNGMMLEGYATVPPPLPFYGNPVLYKYDPAKAKALLKEAGCLPCKVTFAISTSGSGQMQPLPMNELVKSQMDAAGFDVKRTHCRGARGDRKTPAIRRDQCQPRLSGPVQRAHPPCLDRILVAKGRQLGAL
jgi:peptide/nickel transport system substrate-binding protein